MQTIWGVSETMPVFNLFSRRKRYAERGSIPEIYQYNKLPQGLRIQIIRIWENAIGPCLIDRYGYAANANKAWQFIHDAIAQEKGVFQLCEGITPLERCANFLLQSKSVEDCLDIIEFTFKYIAVTGSEIPYKREMRGATQDPEDAIQELNFRMRESAFGYQFEGGQIIRIDSQFIHSEVTRPMLKLLHAPMFKGTEEEFLNAHAHYRVGDYKDAIVDALNAFESCLKSICDARNWHYAPNARASDLVKIIRREKLLPDYLDNSFDQLVATLQSGLPTVRNEEGAHGQGTTPRETPGYIAGYALHLTASNIVLLGEAFKELG